MKNHVCLSAVGSCLLVLASACVPLQGAVAGKKFVVFGWEFGNASPSNILQVVDSLDRLPIDGIGMYPRLTDRKGKPIKAKMMDQPALEWEDLEPWVPALRELTSHRSMKESFMKSICAPTNRIDWTDDASWQRVSQTMRFLARLAREGGLKGVSVDDEDYHRQRQYYWRPGDPQYDRLCEIARQRGREVFSAMFAEYPDMTVFFFRFLTRSHEYGNSADLESSCRTNGDLWPSFINGVLDVLPPTAKLVDGYEYGYRFDAENNGYYRGNSFQKSRFVNLAAPENRAKYFAQVSSAAAIYMDMYVNSEGKRWYSPPLNGSRTERFIANVTQAAHAVDEYVWFWGERCCWADWNGKMPPRKWMTFKKWTEELPGIADALDLRRNPHRFATERLEALKRTGKFRPLNVNGECVRPEKVGSDGLSKPYSSWSDPTHGNAGSFAFDVSTGEHDSSSLVAEGVSKGCFVVSSGSVKPGEIYIAGFSAKGNIVGGIIYWKRDGKWDFSIPGQRVPMLPADANGWKHGLTAVRIPDNANGFAIQLSVRQDKGERCWFDNVFYCNAELATEE